MGIMKRIGIGLVFLLTIFKSCYSIYEDQVGKWDWRQQLVGCPISATFEGQSKAASSNSQRQPQLVVVSKEQAIAALNMNTGKIAWRRLQETNITNPEAFKTIVDEKYIYSLVDDGRILRAWTRRTGTVSWQEKLEEIPQNGPTSLLANDDEVLVLSGQTLSVFTKKGVFKHKMQVEKSTWTQLHTLPTKDVVLLSLSASTLTVQQVKDTGSLLLKGRIQLKAASGEKCILIGAHMACYHSDSLQIVDLSGQTIKGPSEVATGTSIRDLFALENDRIGVRGPDSVSVFDLTGKKIFTIQEKNIEAAEPVKNAVMLITKTQIEVYDAKDGKQMNIPASTFERASATRIFVNQLKDEYEILAVFADCRAELFVVNPGRNQVTSEWYREEGLARLAHVEMVDLPLSESQQLIEDEFEGAAGNIISSLIKRCVTQLGQLKRWFIRTLREMFTLSHSIKTQVNSFATLAEVLRNAGKYSHERGSLPLERDLFNLRKMIVASSLDGVVYGLDSNDGAVIWKLQLSQVVPPGALKTALGKEKIPLFVQRTTAHYQLKGQMAVVFQNAINSNGVIVLFDPITGEIIEKHQLSRPIKRVEILPFLGADHVHSLLILDDSERISFVPKLPDEIAISASPIYLMDVDPKGVLEGYKVDFIEKRLVKQWHTSLGLDSNERIVISQGKPAHEKVHSQGRVLIDRNVDYKYLNPNLVALASVDTIHQQISLFLVDSVTGQLVHTAKLLKASPPIHLVHCENWLAYAYWSDRGRRTEIGIMELYEGEEKSNKQKFDSLVPTKTPPSVVAQSYIYAQGVDAMAVSETEQGLTNKAILFALPLGGIHEVTRRFIDATRPLELTQVIFYLFKK
ncbi:hypothetical protein WR25_20113 isoform B [Diploscapter pachys]|uniref:ER membrane protein complex subunit 1 n=1 Tax=Diploscapter pachys TaxID=2018661 RepID=A0A2A2LZL5_9BILA|nr:hypothetical protein WR25_20113 isoform B [Diploscapter pachys]